MAMQLVREAPQRFDYALQLSGFVAPSAHPGDAVLAARQPRLPVFWAHGDQDQAIPFFLDFVKFFPNEPRQAEARFRLGQSYQAKGDDGMAGEWELQLS